LSVPQPTKDKENKERKNKGRILLIRLLSTREIINSNNNDK